MHKGLPLASGVGSSGASAVAAVVAVNELLGRPAGLDLLLRCAMAGEQVGCGAMHPDNVAPALYGGFVLARSADPPDIVRLPVPAGLACAVLHPAIEVHTGAARALLGDTVPLAAAVRQWANVGALVSALYSGDLALLSRALVDHVAEPKRAGLVPGFHAIKAAARSRRGARLQPVGLGTVDLRAGVVARRSPAAAGQAMAEAWAAASPGVAADLWVSPVGTHGRADRRQRGGALMFVSTRGQAPPVRLAEALRLGLAPDGGLYVPEAIPVLTPGEWSELRGRTLPDVATALIAPLVAETFDRDRLGRLMASALSFPIPLVPMAAGVWALELFHGPTLAFKDVGARSMARWLAATAEAGDDGELTVLVATSGDTGGAVAHAFHHVAGTRVVVLYPRGRVSPVQEAQFATLGDNVTAVAVEGSFDDCQRLVKAAFSDRGLSARHRLTSANSISVGRLLPQMAYYAWAVLQLPADAPPPVVVVPSGNLGNVTAGLLAARRGVPIARFVAATTVNDPLPRYLVSGRFEPAAGGADARQRHGRRPPEQLRAAGVAVRRRGRGDAPARWSGCR